MRFDVVFYHQDCLDGFTAAWRVRQLLDDGPAVRFTGLRAGSRETPVLYRGEQRVLCIDVCPSMAVLRYWLDSGVEVAVWDHHLTTRQDISAEFGAFGAGDKLDWLLYDDGESGATLAGIGLGATATPSVLCDYVRDADLWLFALTGSRSVAAYLASLPKEFDEWDEASRLLESNLSWVFDRGGHIRRAQTAVVDRVVQRRTMGRMQERRMVMVNTGEYVSEVGHRLLEAEPYAEVALVWCTAGDGYIRVSLRGRGSVNVGAIAKQFGGGGHHNAAGFRIKLDSAAGRVLLVRQELQPEAIGAV